MAIDTPDPSINRLMHTEMRSLISLQFNFDGRYDMVRFFKLIQEHDMFAMVRLGPFIQAEWNHGFVHVPSTSLPSVLLL